MTLVLSRGPGDNQPVTFEPLKRSGFTEPLESQGGCDLSLICWAKVLDLRRPFCFAVTVWSCNEPHHPGEPLRELGKPSMRYMETPWWHRSCEPMTEGELLPPNAPYLGSVDGINIEHAVGLSVSVMVPHARYYSIGGHVSNCEIHSSVSWRGAL